jgi:hypothetical protein
MKTTRSTEIPIRLVLPRKKNPMLSTELSVCINSKVYRMMRVERIFRVKGTQWHSHRKFNMIIGSSYEQSIFCMRIIFDR